MKIVNGEFTNEITIEKSRFITFLKRVENNDEANEYLAKIKKQFWDASHHCLALIIGSNADIMRSSDDGEPSKTAGSPMLEVLRRNEITNTICITVRYFGGIKLGTGGLTRAYTKSVTETIKKANFIEIHLLKCYEIVTTYPIYNTILPLIKDNITKTTYADMVTLEIAIESDDLLPKLNDLSLGTISIIYLRDTLIDVVVP